MMDNEFAHKRITQSDYRGGISKGHRDKSDGTLRLDLKSLNLKTPKQKEVLKEFLQFKTDHMIEGLFPEEQWDTIKGGKYLDDVYKKLGL
jgi:hypothetical protein